MTLDEQIAALCQQLDAVDASDPEAAHAAADRARDAALVLLSGQPVVDAVDRLSARCAWWGCA
jgi:hypothetical protein